MSGRPVKRKGDTNSALLAQLLAYITAHRLHDGDTLQLDGINSDGGDFPFTVSGALKLYASGNPNDWLEYSVIDNRPTFTVHHGNTLMFETDTSEIYFKIGQAADTYVLFHADSGNNYTRVVGNREFRVVSNVDHANYTRFSNAGGVQTRAFVGNEGLITNVADPTNTQDVATKNYIDALLGIGVANKRWITLPLEGANPFSAINVAVNYSNVGATDYIMIFGIPLPLVVNGKNLIVTDTKITIGDGDAGDYLDRTRFFGLSGTITQTPLLDIDHDTVHGTGAGNFTYAHADFTVGGTYRRGIYYLNIVATNANDFDMQALEMEYYYG